MRYENAGTTCGTYGAYHRHRRRGETPCAECRRAAAEYARERRSANRAAMDEEIRRNRARGRAYSRLADMYPALYRALYDEELSR